MSQPRTVHAQDEVHAFSLKAPDKFWGEQARHLTWHKQPQRVLKQSTKKLKTGTTHPHWSWFPDGEISTCYNCVDRHVEAGNGHVDAIIWDSPVSGQTERYTYNDLQQEVAILGGVLREEGVKRGDVVLIYMPMIPSALIAMLAVNRIGAIHAVVFGGFSAPALAQRIEACNPKAILTASCGLEPKKDPIAYQAMVEQAIAECQHEPHRTIIWQRDQLRWDPVKRENGQRNWQRLVKSARNRGLRADCVAVKSSDGIYIIYTSGTTGTPKGIIREAAGHAVGLNLSIRYLFGIRPGDVMFTASDIGWVVGHSYILYAPLLAGATTVQFEGKPIFPDAGVFWRIIQKYKVNVMFTAPTALRAIRQQDPEGKLIRKVGKEGGLKSLRALFLAGERSEPAIVELYAKFLQQYGAQGAAVIDNWWSSESGSPMTGLAQLAQAGQDFNSATGASNHLATIPGSAGKPMPGFDIRVVDDEGHECTPGTMGNIVLGIPLAPTGFNALWGDETRFYSSYLKRFEGRWLDTGDSGMIDQAGYVHIMSRSDDIINVAAHRLSTGAIEQAICSHPNVLEASVVGIPDALKGHLPFAFVVLDQATATQDAQSILPEVQKAVRNQLGGIATLGGMIAGRGMIPKTRSGKTLRRVLRDLLENAVEGQFEKEVQVPSTIEDLEVVAVARRNIKGYFELEGNRQRHRSINAKL